jgi:glutamyl/glutaminyl-tRNA synthetase
MLVRFLYYELKTNKMKKILVLSLALILGLSVTAQEKFTEGKIIMNQTFETDNEQMKAMLQQMMGEDGMQTISYVKGNKSRTDISNPMSGDITTISDMETKQILTLMDSPMVGKKFTLTSITKEEEEKIKDNIKIVEGTKTKTILGYECKEQTVTVDQDGVKMEMVMFLTDKIVPAVSQQTAILGDKLKGFPMYMEMKMNQQGMKMTIITEVMELNKEAVADGKFSMTPPEGYTEM